MGYDLCVTEQLAGQFGVRFAGTAAEHAGARYIRGEFEALGLHTSLEWFRFVGWELQGDPELRITAPFEKRLPCFALVYSPSTPPEGTELPVRHIGPTSLLKGLDCTKYALIDPDTGLQQAHVITRLDGPGAAMTLLDPARAVPSVLIGGPEAREFGRWVRQYPDLRARLTIRARLNPDAVSCNVLATLPGRDCGPCGKTVIVAAHHDTQYNSPGAVDNASGVEVLVALARRLVQGRPAKSVCLIAFGAEESMMLGAKHHAQHLEETGHLGQVDALVNIDMPGCNAPLRINVPSRDQELGVCVARVFERHRLFDRFPGIRFERDPWPTSDHAPFMEAGVPTVYISHRGLEYPHLHLPTDTLDKVDRDLVQLSVDIHHDLLADLVGPH